MSRIGAPITEPSVAEIRAEMCGQGALPEHEIRAIVADTLGELPRRTDTFVSGLIGIY